MYYEGHSSNGPYVSTSPTVVDNFHKMKEHILLKYRTKSNVYEHFKNKKSFPSNLPNNSFLLICSHKLGPL